MVVISTRNLESTWSRVIVIFKDIISIRFAVFGPIMRFFLASIFNLVWHLKSPEHQEQSDGGSSKYHGALFGLRSAKGLCKKI